MFEFNNESYINSKRQNTDILKLYKESMLNYLQRLYPDIDQTILEQHVTNIITEYYKPRKTTVVYHDREKEDYIKMDVDLLNIANKTKDRFIFAPSGTTFDTNSQEELFHRSFILIKQEKRKKVKKKMIQAEAEGDHDQASFYNNRQMGIKIDINSISGVLNTNIFFKSKWNFNAITSTSRFGIMLAYGIIERFLCGNLYLPTIDDVIDFINRAISSYPGDKVIRTIIRKYNFYQPTKEDVYDYLIRQNLLNYTMFLSKEEDLLINDYLDSLTNYEYFFIYYLGNLWNIISANVTQFREWVSNLFLEKANIVRKYLNMDEENIEPSKDIDKLKDESLLTLCLILCSNTFKKYKFNEILNYKRNRAIVVDVYQLLTTQLKKQFDYIFKHLINVKTFPSNSYYHNRMLRKCVLVSDTDSVIFTVERLVRLLNYNKTIVTSRSVGIGNMLIFLAQKHLDHAFKHVSAELNIQLEDLDRLKLKNEYYYTSILRTPIKKNYLGLVTVREGALLNPPKLDIKGQIFVKSSLSKELKSYFKSLVSDILNQGSTNKHGVNLPYVLNKVLELEQLIVDSVNRGENTYLLTIPIRPVSEYKSKNKSAYVFYELFMEVLAEVYDIKELLLPQKFKKIPLRIPLSIKNLHKLQYIKETNQHLYERLSKFLSKYPNKEFRFLYLPDSVTSMPNELFKLIDYDKIIYDNCFSFYVILFSLGYVFPLNKTKFITLSKMIKGGYK